MKCIEIGCENEAEGVSPICGPCVNKACEYLNSIGQSDVGSFGGALRGPAGRLPSQLDRIEEMLKQLTTGEFRGELNRIESKLDKLLKDKVHACTIGGH